MSFIFLLLKFFESLAVFRLLPNLQKKEPTGKKGRLWQDLQTEAWETQNTSDVLTAIKYTTKAIVCKPLFRFFVTKNIVYF